MDTMQKINSGFVPVYFLFFRICGLIFMNPQFNMRRHGGEISSEFATILPLFSVNPGVIFIPPLPSFPPPLYPHQVGQLMWDSGTATPPPLRRPLSGAGGELRTQRQEFRNHLIPVSNLNSLCSATRLGEHDLNMFNNAPFLQCQYNVERVGFKASRLIIRIHLNCPIATGMALKHIKVIQLRFNKAGDEQILKRFGLLGLFERYIKAKRLQSGISQMKM